jgi:maltose alpha-D-glucosyltransferase/alpha-amylase
LAKTESPQAIYLRDKRDEVVARLKTLARSGIGHVQTRIHGDFHLGQVLVAAGDAYIIDFEGEPAKPLDIRRRKSSPLRDVAGLLRSFHYAAATAQQKVTAVQKPEALTRFSNDMSEQFLAVYNEVCGELVLPGMLDLFLIEKSAYEICYEAANRPAWLSIPLGGLFELVHKVLDNA